MWIGFLERIKMNKNEYFRTFYIPKNMGVAGKLFGVIKISTALQIMGAWLVLYFLVSKMRLQFSVRVAVFFVFALLLAFLMIALNNKKSLPKTIKHFVNYQLTYKILIPTGYLKVPTQTKILTREGAMTKGEFRERTKGDQDNAK